MNNLISMSFSCEWSGHCIVIRLQREGLWVTYVIMSNILIVHARPELAFKMVHSKADSTVLFPLKLERGHFEQYGSLFIIIKNYSTFSLD